MIAVDTNLLVYAHRAEYPLHQAALKAITGLAERGQRWAIPWPCVHEFLAVVTHPRIHKPPSTMKTGLEFLDRCCQSPGAQLIGEGDGYWPLLQVLLKNGKVAGGQVHDARVAAICLHHQVAELWSADRDFTRYPQLKLRNPLTAP